MNELFFGLTVDEWANQSLPRSKERNLTIPTQMNCAHQGEGWCVECVNGLVDDVAYLKKKIGQYEEGLADAHRMLNLLGVPDAQGQPCNEPGCETLLGHRLRWLLKRKEKT